MSEREKEIDVIAKNVHTYTHAAQWSELRTKLIKIDTEQLSFPKLYAQAVGYVQLSIIRYLRRERVHLTGVAD